MQPPRQQRFNQAAVALSLAAVVGVALYARVSMQRDEGERAKASDASSTRAHCYSMSWSIEESRWIGAEPIQASTSLEGLLCKKQNMVWWTELHSLSLSFEGQPVSIDKDELLNTAFVLEPARDGGPKVVKASRTVAPGAGELARSLLLALHALPTAPVARTVRTSLGLRGDQARAALSSASSELVSEFLSYQSPAALAESVPRGLARVTWRGPRLGAWHEAFYAEEVVQPGYVSRKEKLTLQRVRPSSAPPQGTLKPLLVDAEEDEKALLARAGDLSPGQIKRLLSTWPAGLSGKALGKFLFQAVAVLRLHSELGQELVEQALTDAWSKQAQSALADLLRGAGTDSCQKALLDLLNGTNDADAIVQRIGLLERPNEQVVSALTRRLEEAPGLVQSGEIDTDSAHAVRFAAGSTARALKRNNQPIEAATLVGLLEAQLHSLEEPGQRALLLRALGNAGGSAELVRAASSIHPSERSASAAGLRFASEAEEVDALHELVGDDNSSVQHAALSSLQSRGATPSDLEALAQVVLRGELHAANLVPAANLFLTQEDISPYRAALLTIKDEADGLARLRARIDKRLGSASSTAP